MSYRVSEAWEHAYQQSAEKEPTKTVFNEVYPVQQTENYDCGPAIMASLYKTVGIEDATAKSVLSEFRHALEKEGLDIEETGVPPRFFVAALREHNIPFVEKPSDENFKDPEVIQNAIDQLKEELKKGRVCIAPIQFTPSRWMTNTKTGEILLEDDLDLETCDPTEYTVTRTSPDWNGVEVPEQYDGPDAIMATTKNDIQMNGHHLLVVGSVSHLGRNFFITFDSSYSWLQELAMDKREPEKKDINPALFGYRFIEESVFAKKWHDVSAEGDVFNQYYIAVDVSKKHN